jgi:hypothetical protein
MLKYDRQTVTFVDIGHSVTIDVHGLFCGIGFSLFRSVDSGITISIPGK